MEKALLWINLLYFTKISKYSPHPKNGIKYKLVNLKKKSLLILLKKKVLQNFIKVHYAKLKLNFSI